MPREVSVEPRFTSPLGVRAGGATRLGALVCLTHETCLTALGKTTLTTTLEVKEAVKVGGSFGGRNGLEIPLLRPLKGPLGDWWHRSSVKDKTGVVHYYRDRSGKLVAIQHQGKLFSP